MAIPNGGPGQHGPVRSDALTVQMAAMASAPLLLLMGSVVLRTSRRGRRHRRPVPAAASDLSAHFDSRQLAELAELLLATAATERARLDQQLADYVAGRTVGYVTAVANLDDGISLELSDGQHLALNGIAHRSRRLIRAHASADLLRPVWAEREHHSYRLLLHGHRGGPVELYARRMVLRVKP
jgi:hypothetical protein